MRSSSKPFAAPKQRYLSMSMRRAMTKISYWMGPEHNHRYLERIKKYIANHKDQPEYLNARRSKNKSDTILTWACANGYIEVLQELLKCDGLDINAKNYHGESALILAARAKNSNVKRVDYEKMIDMLLAYPGINVNQSGCNRETALTLSLRECQYYNSNDIVIKILRHGGHDLGSLQETFNKAVKKCRADVVAAILENPDINVRSKNLEIEPDHGEDYKVSALRYAVVNGYIDIVTCILNHPSAKYTVKDVDVENSILDATKKENTKMVIAFIEKDLDAGFEIFTWAAKKGYQDVIETLMNKPSFNGNSILRDGLRDGHNHLTWAIDNDQIGIAEQLLNHPAIIDVNAHTKKGNTALILAVKSDLSICDSLLARPGIEVNAPNDIGDTALINAAACGFTLPLQSLLKAASIDVNLSNGSGETALIAACKFGEQECIESLLARSDLKINAVDNTGHSALITAVMSGRAENVKALLMRNEIDLNISDKTGKTALMYAAELGLTNVVTMLAANDVSNINSQDKNGDTALILAARSHDNAIIIETLFEYGANANIKNNTSYTALMVAKKAAHKGICPLLKNPPVHLEYQAAPPYAPAAFNAPSAPPMEQPAPSAPALDASKPSSPRLGLFAQQPTREPSSSIKTNVKAALRKSI